MLYNCFHLFGGLVRRTLRRWPTSVSFLLFAVLFRIKLIDVAGQVQDEGNKAEPDLVLLVARLNGALLHPLDKGREHDEVRAGEHLPVWKHLVRHPLLHQGARHPEHQTLSVIALTSNSAPITRLS